MSRIGITQRVEHIESYGERRDCLDQQWFVFFEKIGLTVIAIPNALQNPIVFCKENDITGFILSGGNDIASLPGTKNIALERDKTETMLLDYAREHQYPVIGICRGLQFMNLFLGGTLETATGHVATTHEVQAKGNPAIFQEIRSVNSYHNFVVPQNGLGEGLSTILYTRDTYVEAVEHQSLPWLGLMWHPERSQPFLDTDIQIFKTHFNKFI